MRHPGYLGKTPHRGDFVRHNVPTLLRSVWQDWLDAVLLEGERDLTDWKTIYDAAPPCRFALSGGIAGQDSWVGVLIASRDSVGRRYPFVLFGALPDTLSPVEALAGGSVHDALETLACRAVSDEPAYDTLKEALGELFERSPDPNPTTLDPPFLCGAAADVDDPVVGAADAGMLGDRQGTGRILDAVLRQSCGQYSLWQRGGTASASNAGLIITGGLPRGATALALFGAPWSQSAGGWLAGEGRTDTLRPRVQPVAPAPAAVPVQSEETSDTAMPIGVATLDSLMHDAATPELTPSDLAALDSLSLEAATLDPTPSAGMTLGAAAPEATAAGQDDAPAPQLQSDDEVESIASPYETPDMPPPSDTKTVTGTPEQTAAADPPAPERVVETLRIEDEDADAPWDPP